MIQLRRQFYVRFCSRAKVELEPTKDKPAIAGLIAFFDYVLAALAPSN